MENILSSVKESAQKGHAPISSQAAPEFETPFEHIALAFSGGGFRAAVYAMGVLSYFNNVRFKDGGEEKVLLDKVTYLSSASGGTIATALYALYAVKFAGEDVFGRFYKKLSDSLLESDLLNKTLDILNDRGVWKNNYKNKNIINAFAIAYDTYLFDGATVKDLKVLKGEDNAANIPLEEVCFNTTEFFRGLLFKQQVKLKYDFADEWFQYGSSYVYLYENASERLRLGDLLAASSCFPGGFEPIVFPDDFAKDAQDAQLLAKELVIRPESDDIYERRLKDFPPKVGMMDGGITDNQGLESMMRADERRRRGHTKFEPFDLLMVNDVGSNFMDPYTPPQSKSNFINGLINFWTVSFVLVLVLIACFWHFKVEVAEGLKQVCVVLDKPFCGCGALAAGVLLLVLLLIPVILLIALKDFSGSVKKKLLRYMGKMSWYVLSKMAQARVSSIIVMATEVFLKRVRQLLYSQFYGSPVWKNRGKGNHIYDLAFSNDIKRSSETPDDGELKAKGPVPSRPMQIVAETAFNMGTTLWFDDEDARKVHQPACIVATGQFTTCYNLLEYILRLKQDGAYDALKDEKYKRRIDEIEKQLERDFESFKQDPFYLYKELGKQYVGSTFKDGNLSWQDIPFPENFKGIS